MAKFSLETNQLLTMLDLEYQHSAELPNLIMRSIKMKICTNHMLRFACQTKCWRENLDLMKICIRILFACKRRDRFFPSTATNNSFVSLYILKHFSAESVSVSIICWALFQIFISTSWNAIVKKEGIPTLRRFVGSTLMAFEGINSPRGHSTLRAELNKN